jgi:ribosomal protein S18 acetylase RimI-like enzyme
MSSRLCLRNLKWSDYANTRALMAERFCAEDLRIFVQLWPQRNGDASFCWEWSGTVLGFVLVVDFRIEYLVVDEVWEGKGLGQALLKKAVRALKEQGFRSAQLMTANNEHLRAWYSKQGFEYSSSFCDHAGIFGDRMILRFRALRSCRSDCYGFSEKIITDKN